MRKLIALALGAGLLVLGTGAVLAQTAPTPTPSATTTPQERPDKDGLLSDVLADLVSDGTINQSQADKIISELQARRDARRAAAEAQRQQLRGFLEDGVITADELAQLPADSPLRQLESLLDDGQITQDELQQLGRGFGFGRGPGGFGHHGWGPKDGTDPNASPAPSATPSA